MNDSEVIVKSNFRRQIDNYQILIFCIYYMPIIIAGVLSQLLLIYIFDKTWVLNVIYFFVGIGRLIGVGENPLYILWGLNAMVYWIAITYYLTELIPKSTKVFLTCPKCRGSVIVHEDWLCDKCEQAQGKNSYVTDSCKWCHQKRDQIRCDRCGIRIDL